MSGQACSYKFHKWGDWFYGYPSLGDEFNMWYNLKQNNMKTFGIICATVITIILSAIIGGFVFMKLWLWIIVPIFHIRELVLMESIALSFFLSYITYHRDNIKNDGSFSEIFLELIGRIISFNLIILGAGWIIHLLL